MTDNQSVVNGSDQTVEDRSKRLRLRSIPKSSAGTGSDVIGPQLRISEPARTDPREQGLDSTDFVQLKIRWRASFEVRGGFDSLALSEELTQSLAPAQRNAPRRLSWPGGVSRGLLFPLLSPPAPFIVRPVRVRLARAREPGLEPPSPATTPPSQGGRRASDARRLGFAGCLLARATSLPSPRRSTPR